MVTHFTQLSVDAVLEAMPSASRDTLRPEVSRVMDHYAGLEIYVAPILVEASRAGQLPKYLEAIGRHYDAHLGHYRPEQREDITEIHMRPTRELFRACYEELEIPIPTTQVF